MLTVPPAKGMSEHVQLTWEPVHDNLCKCNMNLSCLGFRDERMGLPTTHRGACKIDMSMGYCGAGGRCAYQSYPCMMSPLVVFAEGSESWTHFSPIARTPEGGKFQAAQRTKRIQILRACVELQAEQYGF